MSAIEFDPEDLERRAAPELSPLKPLNADLLAANIARRHGLTVDVLKSQLRYKHLVRARAELYRALREAGWSYPAIGRFVGDRDHTTILIALASPEKRLARAVRAKEATRVPA